MKAPSAEKSLDFTSRLGPLTAGELAARTAPARQSVTALIAGFLDRAAGARQTAAAALSALPDAATAP